MKASRCLLAAATLYAANALAHPGHEAPPVHAHDVDELVLMVAVILVAAVAGLGVRAVVRSRKNRARHPE